MKNTKKLDFCSYFEKRITTYKKDAVRLVTYKKYELTLYWLKKIAKDIKLSDLDRSSYQNIINLFAESHEKQTTMDFHHHLRACLLDAVDEGLLDKDPTRKAIIKGKNPKEKRCKFLNQFELHVLLQSLKLKPHICLDWLILLIAKTGLRFSEAIALTPADFDFSKQMLTVNKTWDYKFKTGFTQTKNKSSVRKIQMDWMLVSQFAGLLKDKPNDKPIFVENVIYNSTINDLLKRRCIQANIPIITIHGLRHTHASLLLFGGVSIASVAKRLGHSNMNTTEKTYLHIIRELENKDIDLVMKSLSGL